MALALTGEHLALAEAVRGWAARAAPAATLRAVAAGEDPGALYRDALRPGLAGQGLLGLHLPEPVGGQGYGLPELAVALEELGRSLLPGGFLPTVLASAVLATTVPATTVPATTVPATADAAPGFPSAGTPARDGAPQAHTPAGATAGQAGELLAGLATGTLNGAVALGGGMRLTAASGDSDVEIDGTCGPVLGAPLADLVILPASDGQDEIWIMADAAGLQITPLESLDLTRPAGRVDADHLTVARGRVLAGLTRATVTSLAAALFGAEACGIADWAVATAAEYAKVRHQFGRPIGQFQAVKHRCGWMLTASEQAAAAVWDAARALQDTTAARGEREFAAGVSAVIAADAAVTCTHECIQVLGGIGYTWEHAAHLYYRRALSLRALLGRPGGWAGQVAALAVAGSRRPVSVDVPAEAGPVRDRVRRELARISAAAPADRVARLADGGWVIPHLARPWGRGAGPLEQIVIAEEMRAAGLRPPVIAIGAWVVPALIRYGTSQQQQRFLPGTLRGEIMWCQLFSEPEAGSDLAGLRTRAVRTEGGWQLTGQKVWTSLAREAHWGICLARTGPGAPRHEGITCFLVDMTAPGVRVKPLREMTGDALFNEVFLDGAFVPDDLVVGAVDDGWRVARTTLANERVSLSQSWAFGCGVPDLVGVLAGLGPGADPAVLERAGRLVCEGHAIDLLGMRVTLKQLSGTDPGATGSVRKLLGMRHAQQVAEECWSLTGADGVAGSARWARAVLFTRALTIGGGTTDIQLNIIGERILGLPRDPVPGG